MKRIHWLLLAAMTLVVACPAQGLSETQCPWMNDAIAAGFLRGEVQGTVTGVSEAGDATCEFTRGTNSMLRIVVRTMPHVLRDYSGYLAQCGISTITLNQAVRCISRSGVNKGEDLIIGRVRDRAFVITIKAEWITRPPSSPTKTRNPISDDSENIAEQVAGSVF